MRAKFATYLLWAGLFTLEPGAVQAVDLQQLWHAGTADGNDAEFALAPSGYQSFKQDGFFIVGESEPKLDWPYVQPGPADSWAGSHQHTFTLLFGLSTLPAKGECRLAIHLVDTHYAAPPKLRVEINGQGFERSLPSGAGDASLNGEPTKGRHQNLEVVFPSELLRAGDNDIEITSVSGSWMLYDSIDLETPVGGRLATVKSRTVLVGVEPIPALRKEQGTLMRPIVMTIRHVGPAEQATAQVQGGTEQPLTIQQGDQTIELAAPDVKKETTTKLWVQAGEQILAKRTLAIKPLRHLTVYILPHSHNDIGYTEIQTAVEQKQMSNLLEGMAAAKRTANYPAGARFVWNMEVLWAADLFMHRMSDQQKADFLSAVKNGQIALNGMYANELTGLCRPEELIQLFRVAADLSKDTGVPIDSAMISDVPGYTWGTVTALAQAGIKYFSAAPNYFDRMGTILRDCENKPFYWKGPDGKTKVLAWIPFRGYAMSHIYGRISSQLIGDLFDELERTQYPYDITYVRWAGHGDNAAPDPEICDFVKDWNAKYAWPQFIISSTSEAFHTFENKYSRHVPVHRGDWTPYWEDGAGSSALETGINRNTAERLAQADSLWAMLDPRHYPAGDFHDGWRNVLLYSEHTWGAWCSVTEPERKETKEQWEIKKSYVEMAERQSRDLLEKPLEVPAANENSPQVDIFNTASWTRSELVTISSQLSAAGARVTDQKNNPVPSQRLSSGELVFFAKDVPPFAARRYTISAGDAYRDKAASAHGTVLDSGVVHARVDDKTGGIVELTSTETEGNLVDCSGGEALNDYLYLPGDALTNLQRSGLVRISVGERGPLVASLVLESDAPGCEKLRRELRVTAGQDYVELIDLVDKARLQATNYKDTKESVNFAFPFNVPDGDLLLDIPLGVMRPEMDQIPGSCKNWFPVGRWVDVSNRKQGVTWVTLDAPLIEVGGITATLLNSQADPNVWRQKVGRTQRFYSWVMNNHWGTNYRAYQEGATVFRFILRPHRKSNPAEATRFATGFTQPLLARRADTRKPALSPLLRISSDNVLATDLKPADDGKAWIIRLFGASGKDETVKLTWGKHLPSALLLSDTSERAKEKINGAIKVPGYGVVTVRAEF